MEHTHPCHPTKVSVTTEGSEIITACSLSSRPVPLNVTEKCPPHVAHASNPFCSLLSSVALQEYATTCYSPLVNFGALSLICDF